MRRKPKLVSKTTNNLHRTTLDWTAGAFSPEEVRLFARVGRRHGFRVSVEQLGGACWMMFEKEW